MMTRKPSSKTARARALRRSLTKSERLLWSILRGKQLCGLKFRRQHPIGPFFGDFACVSKKLVIEIDGGCHDAKGTRDLEREEFLRNSGWDVIRFRDRDVENDADTVARGIAEHLGLKFEFRRRDESGSGMDSVEAPEGPRQAARPLRP